MKKGIYFALLWGTLLACGGERKPLEILPLVAEDVMLMPDFHLETKYYPMPNFFYFKNFRDDKECLKEFLQYVKDTIATNMAEHKAPRRTDFFKNNRGTYIEDGEAYIDQACYEAWFADSLINYFQWFTTSSKYEIWRLYINEFPKRCNYKYNIVRKDKVAVVYFDYKEFNTDVWQKFLNVVFYDREKIWKEDYKKYDLWKDNVVLAWRNWSAPTRYCLLNQRTKEIECVIKYPLADNYNAFTMEIH